MDDGSEVGLARVDGRLEVEAGDAAETQRVSPDRRVNKQTEGQVEPSAESRAYLTHNGHDGIIMKPPQAHASKRCLARGRPLNLRRVRASRRLGRRTRDVSFDIRAYGL